MEYEDTAGFVIDHMIRFYPEILVDYFRLDALPANCVEFLEEAGRNRNCIGRNNVIDYERISRIVITEFRQWKIGQRQPRGPRFN